MDRYQLEHAIRSSCAVANVDEVWVIGSQAILGSFPNANPQLLRSEEVDIQPKDNPDASIYIDGALGEESMFHRTHGFYVHGIEVSAATLPPLWQERAIKVCDDVGTLGYTGYCLEPHDLAVSKLAAFRPKDIEFVEVMIKENMLDKQTLYERFNATEINTELKKNIEIWLENQGVEIAQTPLMSITNVKDFNSLKQYAKTLSLNISEKTFEKMKNLIDNGKNTPEQFADFLQNLSYDAHPKIFNPLEVEKENSKKMKM